MDATETTPATQIEAILRAYDLPPAIPARSDDPSGWLTPIALQARTMCRIAGAEFLLLGSGEMQAVAIQGDDVEAVAIYQGMFWMLCRFAAVAAGSGVFPAMEGTDRPSWTPDVVRSLHTPRELLEEATPFDWQAESLGWKQAPERQMLFYLVLNLMFRFVLFHELGHLRNDHGRRRMADPPMLVDRLGPALTASDVAIPAQAREIVADGYALMLSIDTLEKEVRGGQETEMGRIIRDRLFPDDAAIVHFVMTIVNLYFRLADRSDWQSTPLDRLTHPPAPFRMKALFALLYEQRPLNLDEDRIREIIMATELQSDALMSVMLDIIPNPGWLKTVSTPEHDRHFRRLYEEFPRWSGRMAAPRP